MTTKKIKGFVLDNEWVIVQNNWDLVAEAIHQGLDTPILTGNQTKQSFRIDPATGEYDNKKNPQNVLYQYNRGLITADHFWSAVLQGSSYQRKPTAENIAIMSDAFKQLTTDVDPTAIEAIHQIKQAGTPLYMLSNSAPEINQGNRDRDSYFALFDICFFSFYHGWRKPEPQSYQAVIAQAQNDFGIGASELLFVDDKQENLDGALREGMQTLYHKIGDGNLLKKVQLFF